MITNPASKIYSSINALPEIKNRREKTSGTSGMMSPLLKKTNMPTNKNSIEKEPAFIVAKIQQRIKKDRQEIKDMKNAT
tara:strand:- start:207 stop:443 length:237 start_codon:yes stop_codon:yes gene_type:complete